MTDPTECWPPKWREDFERENADLVRYGEEALTPALYLQCRYEDREEQRSRDEQSRLHNWNCVYQMVLEVQAKRKMKTGFLHEDAGVCVENARKWADLAYPPVKP